MKFVYLLLFALMGIIFAPSDGLADEQLKKFKAGYLPTAEHVLYFVAKEKGLFQKNALDVELFRFTNSAEGLAAVKAGKLDSGFFGTAAPLAFIANGAEFTIFGGGGGEGAALVAKPEKAEKYKELKDLKGATIGVVRLATGDVVFRAALKKAGLDWRKDVTFKEFDSPAIVLEALKKGELDAGILWIPFYTLAEKQGLKIIKYSGDVLKGHTCCRQVALTAAIRERPEDFEKFLTALLGGGDYFGELSLGSANKSIASVKTLTKSVFLTIERSELDALLKDKPELRKALAAALEERAKLRETANSPSNVQQTTTTTTTTVPTVISPVYPTVVRVAPAPIVRNPDSQNPIKKLGRGIFCAVFAFMEIPINMADIAKKEGPPQALSYGFFKGVGFFIFREVVATFPIPLPGTVEDGVRDWGYGPLLEPEWIFPVR